MSEVGEANYPAMWQCLGESSYDRREEITNNEVGERNERVITVPGKVLRLHASVIVIAVKAQ